ncbi:hypothetical protein MADA3029_530002 [Vibrio nigripulchritudo MADA3029]|uniref:hypothetical protein n=1 Tax=Vibrio nigripulchritudo TaxID=28173 RepID=UPI0003B1C794|nr:hypothetical protein [Vibrio nigripulchritudo]CCN48150.1 hypothetical protein VIBNIMADA3020_570070 [Vibrio nigripulchritudo MADA3020]CCN54936.1 hypothetical protein VIBNIMADA3021_630002 [Vibrio nigripulchritudo MADA3021]CCN60081.1 hypothetical protein MADA3029_530002 [Vibrio nigripulchritudo MADA3029]
MTEVQSHGIKIDFDKKVENASRVFHSMGQMIDGFHEAQQVVLDSLSLDITIKSSLSRTIEGSCISVEEKTLVFRNTSDISVEKGFLDKLMDIFTDFLGKPENEEIDNRTPIDDLVEEAQNCIESNIHLEGKSALNVSHISAYNLAKALEKIVSGINKLDKKDSVYIGSSKDSETPNKKIRTDVRFKRSVDEIFSQDKVSKYNEIRLEICSVSLNEASWKFRWVDSGLKKTQFSAKIKDDKWLQLWLNRSINIRPGDGINAAVTLITDKNRNIKSATIDEVHYPIFEIGSPKLKKANSIYNSNENLSQMDLFVKGLLQELYEIYEEIDKTDPVRISHSTRLKRRSSVFRARKSAASKAKSYRKKAEKIEELEIKKFKFEEALRLISSGNSDFIEKIQHDLQTQNPVSFYLNPSYLSDMVFKNLLHPIIPFDKKD